MFWLQCASAKESKVPGFNLFRHASSTSPAELKAFSMDVLVAGMHSSTQASMDRRGYGPMVIPPNGNNVLLVLMRGEVTLQVMLHFTWRVYLCSLTCSLTPVTFCCTPNPTDPQVHFPSPVGYKYTHATLMGMVCSTSKEMMV